MLFETQLVSCYDLIYSQKEYDAEARFLSSTFARVGHSGTRVLDLGCGTGSYEPHLEAMGFSMVGVDQSPAMVQRAQQRVLTKSTFHVGDARTFRVEHEVDLVLALFHVFNYFDGEDSRSEFLRTSYNNLRPGGLLVFDFWHGAGVLADPPKVRVLRRENREIRLLRITEPELDAGQGVVNVNFDFHIWDKTGGSYNNHKECHRMHYLFLSELRSLAKQHSFEVVLAEKWMSTSSLTEKDWYGIACLRKLAKGVEV